MLVVKTGGRMGTQLDPAVAELAEIVRYTMGQGYRRPFANTRPKRLGTRNG